MVEVTIEDSASAPGLRRNLTQSDGGCCIEHDFALALEMRASTGTEERGEEKGVKVRSSAPLRRAVVKWRQESSREQNHP